MDLQGNPCFTSPARGNLKKKFTETVFFFVEIYTGSVPYIKEAIESIGSRHNYRNNYRAEMVPLQWKCKRRDTTAERRRRELLALVPNGYQGTVTALGEPLDLVPRVKYNIRLRCRLHRGAEHIHTSSGLWWVSAYDFLKGNETLELRDNLRVIDGEWSALVDEIDSDILGKVFSHGTELNEKGRLVILQTTDTMRAAMLSILAKLSRLRAPDPYALLRTQETYRSLAASQFPHGGKGRGTFAEGRMRSALDVVALLEEEPYARHWAGFLRAVLLAICNIASDNRHVLSVRLSEAFCHIPIVEKASHERHAARLVIDHRPMTSFRKRPDTQDMWRVKMQDLLSTTQKKGEVDGL